MGKFNLKAAELKAKEYEKEKKSRLRKMLKGKNLVDPIPDSKDPIDGILCFGAHRGRKISELLRRFDTVPYVVKYLASDKSIPKKTRILIKKIIINHDPFDSPVKTDGPLYVKEVDDVWDKFRDWDDIPW